MSINLIVAMTKDRVIGNDNTLIWNIKEDMKIFRETTNNSTVIMGKKTWDSIPQKFRPLPGRVNIVLSRNTDKLEGVIVCKSIEESITEAKKIGKEIFCIGGASIYELFLPFVEKLYISWVKKNYEGNVLFPKIDFSKWIEIDSKEYAEFTHKIYKLK
ncbi:MAG: dihydrofolate reductase [archaeon]|jgi:dihydrofolate reductase